MTIVINVVQYSVHNPIIHHIHLFQINGIPWNILIYYLLINGFDSPSQDPWV